MINQSELSFSIPQVQLRMTQAHQNDVTKDGNDNHDQGSEDCPGTPPAAPPNPVPVAIEPVVDLLPRRRPGVLRPTIEDIFDTLACQQSCSESLDDTALTSAQRPHVSEGHWTKYFQRREDSQSLSEQEDFSDPLRSPQGLGPPLDKIVFLLDKSKPLAPRTVRNLIAIQRDREFYSTPDAQRILPWQVSCLNFNRYQSHSPFLINAGMLPLLPDVPTDSELWKIGNRQVLQGRPFPAEVLLRMRRLSLGTGSDAARTVKLDFMGIGRSMKRLLDLRLRFPRNERRRATDLFAWNFLHENTRHGLRIPFWYHMSSPYLMSVYTTDQDVSCPNHHIACSTCAVCSRMVLCEYADCTTCTRAISMSLTDIIGWDSIKERRRDCKDGRKRTWDATNIKDVLYYHLVTLQTGPAAEFARYPFERTGFMHEEWLMTNHSQLNMHHNIDNVWPAQTNQGTIDPKKLGANPYFNSIKSCRDCSRSFVRVEVKRRPIVRPTATLYVWGEAYGKKNQPVGTQDTILEESRYKNMERPPVQLQENRSHFHYCHEHRSPSPVVLPTRYIEQRITKLNHAFRAVVLETMLQGRDTIIDQMRHFPPVQGALNKARDYGLFPSPSRKQCSMGRTYGPFIFPKQQEVAQRAPVARSQSSGRGRSRRAGLTNCGEAEWSKWAREVSGLSATSAVALICRSCRQDNTDHEASSVASVVHPSKKKKVVTFQLN